MAEVFCSNHPEIGAVGKCFQCKKPFCLSCLDLETGNPLCSDCLAGKPAEIPEPPIPEPPAPVFVPPVSRPISRPVSKVKEDTSISLDDLNMGGQEEIKQTSFKVTGPLAFVDNPSAAASLPDKSGDLEVKKELPVASKVTGPLAFMDPPTDSTGLPDKPGGLGVKEDVPAASPKSSEPVMEKPPAGPAGLPPLVFSPMKSLDNDPLGLFKKSSAPSIPVTEPPKPVSANPFADLPKVTASEAKPPEKSSAPLKPSSTESRLEKPGHVTNFDLAGMMNKLDEAEKKAPQTAAFDPDALIPPPDKVSIRDLHAPKKSLFSPLQSLAGGLWLKFNILAARLKIRG
ncbi:MAG TPA: hypothetical protein VN963_00015, partial [bacterium]|nr:hypothetical protein [bacterium]